MFIETSNSRSIYALCARFIETAWEITMRDAVRTAGKSARLPLRSAQHQYCEGFILLQGDRANHSKRFPETPLSERPDTIDDNNTLRLVGPCLVVTKEM